MKEILLRLVNQEELTLEETYKIMLGITREEYSDVQITAFLTALLMRGITPDELLGLRKGLIETGKRVDLSPYEVIDIVGTGGDGKNTFNISTCSCFVVAGAGYKVAKHGNHAATSVSGASDVILGHGVKFSNDESLLRKSIEESNFTYLHAPLFAIGMKYVAPVRKGMQIPTCFNLLGPLVNPSQPSCQLLGVANLNQLRLYDNVNQKLGIKYSIVNSVDGYDEISLTSEFKVKTRNSEKIYRAEDLGLKRVDGKEIYGGNTQKEAIEIFDSVLQNKATRAQMDVVLANSAFAIKAIEKDKDILECLDIARTSLESGKAWNALKKYVELNS